MASQEVADMIEEARRGPNTGTFSANAARTALTSLGIDLEVLAALKAGRMVAVAAAKTTVAARPGKAVQCTGCDFFDRHDTPRLGAIGECTITLPPWMTADSNTGQPIYQDDAGCNLGRDRAASNLE